MSDKADQQGQLCECGHTVDAHERLRGKCHFCLCSMFQVNADQQGLAAEREAEIRQAMEWAQQSWGTDAFITGCYRDLLAELSRLRQQVAQLERERDDAQNELSAPDWIRRYRWHERQVNNTDEQFADQLGEAMFADSNSLDGLSVEQCKEASRRMFLTVITAFRLAAAEARAKELEMAAEHAPWSNFAGCMCGWKVNKNLIVAEKVSWHEQWQQHIRSLGPITKENEQ